MAKPLFTLSPQKLACFTACDVRGRLGVVLDAFMACRVGRVYGEHFQTKCVVVGADVRITGNSLKTSQQKIGWIAIALFHLAGGYRQGWKQVLVLLTNISFAHCKE